MPWLKITSIFISSEAVCWHGMLSLMFFRAFDSQFQNESLSSKLQEELASREEVEHK